MANLTIVHDDGGDWVAYYIDGELVDEGHSLAPISWIEPLLGKTIESLKEYGSFFEEFGRGYETLAEYTDLYEW